jgi:hypothetical protein
MKIFKILNLFLRLAVILVIIEQFRLQNYESAILAVITLIVFIFPVFLKKKIEIPDIIESMLLIAIYASVILGEIKLYYVIIPHWDSIVHILDGFILAAIGYSLINFINKGHKLSMILSPAFTVLYIICFAVTMGVIWELFEYFGDSVFGKDMQKDVYINQINSILLNQDNMNIPAKISIDSVVINGKEWQSYVDIGLIDTMKDMLLNLVGAVFFAVYSYFRIKRSGANVLEDLLLEKNEKNKKT